MSNLNINKIVEAILQLKDRTGSTLRDIQKKLGIVSKKNSTKLKNLLSNAVSNNILTKSTKGRYKIVTSSSSTAKSPKNKSKGVTPDQLKQLDTIHDFGHATNRNAPTGLNSIFALSNGYESFLDSLTLGNVDSNSQLKRFVRNHQKI